MPRKRKTGVADANATIKAKSNKKAKTSEMPSHLKPNTTASSMHVQPRQDDKPRFYQSGAGNNTGSPIQQNLNKLFDHYRDSPSEAPDKIGIDGAQRYLTDLRVEIDEVAFIALSEFLQCPAVGEFEREAFVTGWKNISTSDKPYDTPSKQAQYINVIRQRLLADESYFKQVYRYAFSLAKPETQRSVPMDSAIETWRMFFKQGKGGIEWNTSTTKWLDYWCEYYEKENKRPVNKDLWKMVGELVFKTKESGGESLDWWTEDGAWPMAVDSYIAFVHKKRGTSSKEHMDTS